MDEKPAYPDLTGAVVLKKPEHGISRRNIDPDALRILFRLHALNHTAYLVGGAVRDLMLGKPPKDFDIVTDARPAQIKKYFPRVFIIGRRFRLAHIHFPGNKIVEVATFRKDSGANGPDAAEGRNVAEDIFGSPRQDAFRRDITINALFFDAVNSIVIDYVGGVADLRQGRIRIIGDCAERFREDPVRIWRVIRYAARAGFAIDGDTEREITGHGDLLAGCSGARLYEELYKDLNSAQTRPVIEGLRKYGILRFIIGRAGECYEADAALFARLARLLEIEDNEKANGRKLMLDDMCAVLFWPWLEPRLAAAQGDLHTILNKEFHDAGMRVLLPKGLRAQFFEILVLAVRMIRALRTGRVRWALRGRAQYAQASRLVFLLERDRAPAGEESFESLLQQAFPQLRPSGPPRPRRRRRRKKQLEAGPG
jgi:poly(A) polymerase